MSDENEKITDRCFSKKGHEYAYFSENNDFHETWKRTQNLISYIYN